LKIRAAVLNASPVAAPYALSKPMSIEEVELAPPGPGEVLVRVRAAGLCHSDLSVIDGNRPRPVPMVLGHEAAGEVVETGPGVQDLKHGRPRHHGVRALLRALLPLQRGAPCPVRARQRRQRHR
jgi:Zn-dependent alcohol dehydrogenase